MVALLEAGLYTMMEVSEAAVVTTHASDQWYLYCYRGPNVGLMGHKDLIVALGPDTSNAVVVMVDTRAMEVFKNDCFGLKGDNHMQNALSCHKNSMLDVLPADIEYSSQTICVVHFLYPNP